MDKAKDVNRFAHDQRDKSELKLQELEKELETRFHSLPNMKQEFLSCISVLVEEKPVLKRCKLASRATAQYS